ncbi:MAG: vWA domain-containing protein [Eubacteriales bacterium]
MKNNLTELVFILDKSGSMAGLETDTIGGFNSLLAKQKSEKGDAVITTVLFDNNYEVLHDRADMRQVNPITNKEYFVEGSTALLDALGRTINRIGKAMAQTREQDRPGKVMFVIITDGFENASREFKYSQIKRMIEHQKTKYSWEFIFLGANIDAVEAAAKVGITADRAATYNSDGQGTRLNYDAVCCAVSDYRSGKNVDAKWKKEIDEDFQKRSKK